MEKDEQAWMREDNGEQDAQTARRRNGREKDQHATTDEDFTTGTTHGDARSPLEESRPTTSFSPPTEFPFPIQTASATCGSSVPTLYTAAAATASRTQNHTPVPGPCIRDDREEEVDFVSCKSRQSSVERGGMVGIGIFEECDGDGGVRVVGEAGRSVWESVWGSVGGECVGK